MKNKWITKKIADILQKTENVNPTLYPDREFVYIDISSVSNKSYLIENPTTITGKNAPSRARKKVKSGDVIYATVRPTLKRVTVISDEFDGQICSTGYFVMRPKEFMLNSFLFYFLTSEAFNQKVLKLQKGASYPAINESDIKNLTISFPESLQEQEDIVKELELVNLIINKRNNSMRLVNDYVDAIFFEMFGDPVVNKREWPKSTLGELCSDIADIDHNMPKATSTGYPFISAKDLLDDGNISFDNVKFISEKDFVKLSRKIKPKKGDIIYSRIGARLGKARIVDVDFDFLASYSCCTIRPNNSKIDTIFLNHLLNTPSLLKQALNDVRAIGVPDLGMDKIRAFEIITPPLDMQLKFANSVVKAHGFRNKAIEQSNQLKLQFHSLMQKSFNIRN